MRTAQIREGWGFFLCYYEHYGWHVEFEFTSNIEIPVYCLANTFKTDSKYNYDNFRAYKKTFNFFRTVNKPERDENIVTYNNTLNVKCELNNPHPF